MTTNNQFNGAYRPITDNIVPMVGPSGEKVLMATILGIQMPIKVFRGVPVMTFQDVARVMNADIKVLRNTFSNRSNEFRDGIDYYMLKPEHIIDRTPYAYPDPFNPNITRALHDMAGETLSISKPNNRGTVHLTQSGFFILVCTMRNDRAVKMRQHLIDSYFNAYNAIKGTATQQEIQNLNASYGVNMKDYLEGLTYIPLNSEEMDLITEAMKDKMEQIYERYYKERIEQNDRLANRQYENGNIYGISVKDDIYKVITNDVRSKFVFSKYNLGKILKYIKNIDTYNIGTYNVYCIHDEELRKEMIRRAEYCGDPEDYCCDDDESNMW